MGQSIRYVRRGIRGRSVQNFNWPGVITAKSVVHITAGEVGFGTTQKTATAPAQDFYYHVGDADIWVSNVSPHRNEFNGDPGGVTYVLHVGWDSPLDVAVTITVEDALPVEIQGY
ncbi:hypothetical protein ROT00_04865 [Agromyces mediolanus]|uniref:hypothetical protein n=1 Tax=Agromyces mediolanus TaxID=41986 RepID=UPI000AD11822